LADRPILLIEYQKYKKIKEGSHGGSTFRNGTPFRRITGGEIFISERRGVDQTGVCEHQQLKVGSPGGSPSQKMI
jgi:hypothetical protein